MAKTTVGQKGKGRTPKAKAGAAKKPAKAKVEKKAHPLIGSKKEGVYPFKEAPQDYDPKKHLPLKRKDFDTLASYKYFQAAQLRAKADKLEEDAKNALTKGDKKAQRAKKKLKNLVAQRLEFQKTLREAGLTDEDISALEEEGLEEAEADADGE